MEFEKYPIYEDVLQRQSQLSSLKKINDNEKKSEVRKETIVCIAVLVGQSEKG